MHWREIEDAHEPDRPCFDRADASGRLRARALDAAVHRGAAALVRARCQPGGDGTSTGRVWMNFNDPQLNALIDEALKANNDLAVAVIRVQRARLQAGLANTTLTPDVKGVGLNTS